jgi:hypothetical protein
VPLTVHKRRLDTCHRKVFLVSPCTRHSCAESATCRHRSRDHTSQSDTDALAPPAWWMHHTLTPPPGRQTHGNGPTDDLRRPYVIHQVLNAMAYNGGAYVTWPEPNKGEGHVAEARAVARRSPRRPPRAPMHTTRCYGTLRLQDSLVIYEIQFYWRAVILFK